MLVIMNSYHLRTLVFACKGPVSPGPRTLSINHCSQTTLSLLFPQVQICSPLQSLSPHGSCTDPGRPPSVAQRCSAFLNGSMLVLVVFPWPRSVFVLLVRAALSQDICSLKLGYPAGSWEAWTFPEEWGEGRYPSLATSPIG